MSQGTLRVFGEDLRPQVPQIAQALPQPVTGADVLSRFAAFSRRLAIPRTVASADYAWIQALVTSA